MSDSVKLDSEITVGGDKIAETEIFDLMITSELDCPDTCAITLNKSGAEKHGAKLKVTDELKVKLAHQGDDMDPAFIGEVSGLEPIFSPKGKLGGSLVLRGLNALHELSRGKRSNTYEREDGSLTDKDIVTKVLSDRHSTLTADFGKDANTQPPQVKYFHVYQHNQTDLEFLRLRAARIGCYILVRDKKLLFQKRDATPSGIKLKLAVGTERKQGADQNIISLERFMPRLSTANQVTEVRARSFQPEKRKEMICIAKVGGKAPPKLGTETGTEATQEKHANAAAVRVDVPFGSKEEGEAIALSLLNERLLSYVVAEGTVPGDPRLKPGLIIELETGDKRFDGKYFVTWVRHWYKAAGADNRFTTDFRASRDAVEKPTASTTT